MDSSGELDAAERDLPLSGISRQSLRLFVTVEHAVYSVLGVILSVTAVLGLIGAGKVMVGAFADWTGYDQLIELTDRLLLVLMLVEILHTVRVSLRSGQLSPQPFLIVGLIASIRRVLVITLRSSTLTQSGPGSDTEFAFRAEMIELGVLAALILVMVVSLWLLRRHEGTGGKISFAS